MEPLTVIPLTPEQIRSIVLDAVTEALSAAHIDLQPPPQPAEYLTREQAAELLHVSLPTLRNHARRGLIRSRRIGRRVLYARADVEAALARF